MKAKTLNKLTEYIITTIWESGFQPTGGGRSEPSEQARKLYAELTAEDKGRYLSAQQLEAVRTFAAAAGAPAESWMWPEA